MKENHQKYDCHVSVHFGINMKHLNKQFHFQSVFIRFRSPFTNKWCDAHSISWSPWNYNFCVFMFFILIFTKKKMPSFEFWIIFIFKQHEKRKMTRDKRIEMFWTCLQTKISWSHTNKLKGVLFCFFFFFVINVQPMILMLTCDINKQHTDNRQPTMAWHFKNEAKHCTLQHN